MAKAGVYVNGYCVGVQKKQGWVRFLNVELTSILKVCLN